MKRGEDPNLARDKHITLRVMQQIAREAQEWAQRNPEKYQGGSLSGYIRVAIAKENIRNRQENPGVAQQWELRKS